MRKSLYNALDEIQKMNKKYELKTLNEKLGYIQEKMDEFTLRILFVGGFSAGKSALINAVLGNELLEEGQRPETAVASELVYDVEEYIEAVNGDVKKRYLMENVAQIESKLYDYLIWHINCNELEQYEDCTIVDMPGFNSGIQEHNKAILRYAGNGNAYVLVIDCEDGSIKQNMKEFIYEIKHYDNNIAIAITKTDLKLDEDVERIKESIEANAKILFNDYVPVITTSKYDEDAGIKIKKLIEEFDKDNIFVQQFLPQIYEAGMRCIDSMEVYKKGLKLDLSQFDKEIARHEKTKKELSDKLSREKSALENKFRNSVGPAIIADVQDALYSRMDDLERAIKGGEKSFSMTVNNILRPILLNSTQRYVEQSYDKLVAEMSNFNMDLDASLQDIGANAIEKYQQANYKIQHIAQNSDKFNTTYKAISTALAVATNVIAPWLELIIIFLPDVLKLFGLGTREESVTNKINNEIIPKIITRLQPEVENSLMEMKEDMMAQIEEEIGSLIDNEMESLETARENKEKENQMFDEKMKEVQQDIDEINQVLEKIIQEGTER